MSINVIASIISFSVTLGISFFLTPHLVKTLGTEAFGFIGLANNFVQYATVVTAALNSMSGRFISIAYHRGDKDKASRLFNSVLVADLVIAGVLLVIATVTVLFIDVLLDIPPHLVTSVKITFALSIIVGLFVFLPAKLYYISCATLASGIFLLIANVNVKRKILPDVEIDIKKFEFGLVKILVAAGVWMSLAQLSTVLLSGLDLLICNLTIGAAMMGILSIAKTVPMSFASLIALLGNVFAPHYTILYAKNDIAGLVKEVKFTSKILSFIMTVPIAGFIVFGLDFYKLWQPTKTGDELIMIQIISLLTCLQYLFTAHTQCLTMLNSVCNKMKLPVFVALGVGVLSTAIVLVLVNVFSLGNYAVYAIAGVSSLLMTLRSIVFIPLYYEKETKRLRNDKSEYKVYKCELIQEDPF